MSILLRKIQEKDLELLMNWRMRPDITKYMLSDPVLTMDKQYQWYYKIKKEDRFDFVIEIDDTPVGYFGIFDIDRISNCCGGGVYIAEVKARSFRNFIDIQSNILDFIFLNQKLHKHIFCVFEENPVKNIYKFFNIVFEGKSRDAVYKYGRYFNLLYYSLLDYEWSEIRNRIKYNTIKIDY